MLPASLELLEFHGMPRTSLTFLELLIFQRVLEDDPGVTRSIDWYKCSRLPVDPWMRACKLFFFWQDEHMFNFKDHRNSYNFQLETCQSTKLV